MKATKLTLPVRRLTLLLCGLTLLTGCNALEIHPNPAFMPQTETATATEVTLIPTEVTIINVTPLPEVTLIPEFIVIADTLEIRSGAGENFPNVGYLAKGDRVQVYSRSAADTATCRQWAQISKDGSRWVCAEYLEGVK
jgi:uncharacterized protein YgiM (DUF1202 family)